MMGEYKMAFGVRSGTPGGDIYACPARIDLKGITTSARQKIKKL